MGKEVEQTANYIIYHHHHAKKSLALLLAISSGLQSESPSLAGIFNCESLVYSRFQNVGGINRQLNKQSATKWSAGLLNKAVVGRNEQISCVVQNLQEREIDPGTHMDAEETSSGIRTPRAGQGHDHEHLVLQRIRENVFTCNPFESYSPFSSNLSVTNCYTHSQFSCTRFANVGENDSGQILLQSSLG
ncbi:hypothetical protein R1flu_026034 [Riccia fluitans]|uniref:Uncharacterized protein n=1 Tax=Riccia fluitans TaxID=41844 RepID=A0ABD1XEU1_9MARC